MLWSMNTPFRARALLLAALLTVSCPSPAGDDHARLREAQERGELVPLKSILDSIEAGYVGKIVEVEMDDEDGEFIYEVELLSPSGDVLEFEFDARSGKLLEIEGRNIEGARRP